MTIMKGFQKKGYFFIQINCKNLTYACDLHSDKMKYFLFRYEPVDFTLPVAVLFVMQPCARLETIPK